MAHAGKKEDELSSFTCAICLEIFDKPVKISCGHTFCGSCLQSFADFAEPLCPLCRHIFDFKHRKKATAIENQMSQLKTNCSGCTERMSLSKLRQHSQTCPQQKTTSTFTPIAQTSQSVPSNLPNRSTFSCPYCGLGNLDTQGLVKHCNDTHKCSSARVVCPVCASMPWGDPNQISTNFIHHLNYRHRFEYDTYVDYRQDDDDMLQAALQASLQET